MGRGKKSIQKTNAAASPFSASSSSKKRPASDLELEGDAEPTTKSPFLYQLINSLRDYHDTIAGDKQASHTILQNQLTDKHPLCHLLIASGGGGGTHGASNEPAKNGSDESSPAHHFVYWLFLATHCLQKLAKSGFESDGSAVSAAWLSYSISRNLLSHLPTKQERLSSVAARHVVGRALILVSIAATEALNFISEALGASNTNDLSSETSIAVLSTSLEACVLALDRVTMVQQATSPLGPQLYWNQNVTSLDHCIDRGWAKNVDALQTFISATETLDWSLETFSWLALSTDTVVADTLAVPSDSTGKRTSRRITGTSSIDASAPGDAAGDGATASLLQTMEPLIKQDVTHKTGLDSRLALKRWTAVGLTWYGINGQEKLLTVAHRLLQPDTLVLFSECQRPVVMGPLSQEEQTDALSLDEDEDSLHVLLADDTPEKVKSKPKTRLQPDESLETPAVLVPVPHNVTLVTIVCRLCRIVWEVGNAAGSRPPAAGGFDSYMKGVTGTVVKKSKKLIRAELRDLSMSISYLLIRSHHKCIEENYGANQDKLVINENGAEDFRRRMQPATTTTPMSDDKEAAPFKPLYFYYPYVHKAIGELASASASNAEGGHSVSLLNRWSDRIEYAASSFVFLSQKKILDARLTNYALEKLVSSLSATPSATSGITADTATSSTAVSAATAPRKRRTSVKLYEPLPIPSIVQKPAQQTSIRKRKNAASVSAVDKDNNQFFCSFAGMYDDRAKGEHGTNSDLTCDEKLVLFIRAVQGEAALVSHLVWLVEACYDTRAIEDPLILSTGLNTVENKRKPSKLNGRASKRQKQSGRKAKANVDSTGLSGTQYRQIKGLRAIVATKALDALRLFLRDPIDGTLSDVQSTLVDCVTRDHLYRVIELGSSLEAICATSPGRLSECEEDASARSNVAMTVSVKEVKDMWMSHIDLCLALGKGLSKESLLRSAGADLRQALFEKIARDSKRQSSHISWPLSLRPAHRALVLASLAEPSNDGGMDFDSRRRQPDRFIVDGFTSELKCLFEDLAASFEGDDILGLDECPVSLHDARVFLRALSKVPVEVQKSTLFELLTLVHVGLSKLRTSSILEHNEVCHFLARVVCCCVSTYCVIKFGSSIQEVLDEIISKSLCATSQITSWCRNGENGMEPCFMSVLSDGTDSGLPPNLVAKQEIAKATDELLQKLLEQALSLGYRTAASDKCYLLYAAWNALGKCDLWNDYSNTLPKFDGLPEDTSCLILQLREEMCLVHYEVKRLKGDVDLTSTLVRARDAKARSHRSLQTDMMSLLQGMIRKGCSIVDALLLKYTQPIATTLTGGTPTDVFCLLEACCAYISMAISMFTKPKINFFSSILADQAKRSKGRARGYSTDSDALPSDAGSVDSGGALGESVERLQEVCEYLGSVPSHPDWLDKDCHLMECVSTNEAIETANEAMVCLTKLISVGMIQSQSFLKRAVTQALDPNDGGMVSMIMHFCELNSFDTATHTDAEIRNYAASLGEMCGLSTELFFSLFVNSVSSKRQEAACTWCPFTAQRILGTYQDVLRAKLVRNLGSPELRACGEWEVLLSQSLSSASMASRPIDDGSKLPDDPDRLRVHSERWLVVCRGALDSLVSTVALIRFGIASTGRLSHPLSSSDKYLDSFEFEAMKGAMIEPILSTSCTSETIKRNLHSALAAVARFPPNATCNAIAAHLVVNVESLFALRGILTSAAALRTLSELRFIVTSNKKIQPALLSVLVCRLASVLEIAGTGERYLDGSIRYPILFACLSRNRNQSALVFDTILTKNVDPLDILSIDSTSVDFPAANEWDCVGLTSDFTSSVLFFACHDYFRGFPSAMSFFASALSSLISMEVDDSHVFLGGHGLLSTILNVANDMPEAAISDLIQGAVCGTAWRGDESERKVLDQSGSLNGYTSLFALLLVSRDGTTFKRTDVVLRTLMSSYDKWKNYERYQCNALMSMTLLYASRLEDLHIIGGRIFDDLKRMRKMKTYDAAVTENVMFFAEFVRHLSDTLSFGISSVCEKGPVACLPASCSYTTRKDFHEQHWYNCFTCGLTNDKGCCSLCAVVCHRGHDVVYARYSSFFCDCGSEVEPTILKTCRCLSPQACSDFVKQIREGTYCGFVSRGNSEYCLPMQLSALIVKDSFPQIGVSSLNKLMEKVRNEDWVRLLFECTKREFSNWKTTNEEAEATFTERNQSVRYSNLRTASSYQNSHWNIRALPMESYTFLGASRSGSFQMRMSNHRSTDRKGLPRHGIGRCPIDADSRGRIAIAESSDVSFGTCIPFVNSSTRDYGVTSHSRSTMTSVVSKISVGFRVVGVKFAIDCENLVCVWGATEAKVIFMTNGVTTDDGAVHLELDLSSGDDSADIVSCCWLEGSGTGLVVACSQCIYVFEVSHQKGRVSPMAKIPAAKCSSNIRDFTIVRLSDTDELMWNFFVLLENGKIHEATFSLSTPSDTVDISQSLSKANEFIGEAMDDTSVEIISITFLTQSSFLLCETRSSGTLALLLDVKGEFLKAIKFLPFNLDPSLFKEIDGCTYHGPFTRWKELGIVCRSSEVFFTLSFAGLRSAADPVLLYIEFNESGAFIRELAKNNNSVVESLESYEGFAVFTAPIALAETNILDLTETRLFVERIFLCAVSLDGSMQLYAEEASAPSRAALEPQGRLFHITERTRTPERTFEQVFIDHSSQLISLEKMENTTLSHKLVFGSVDIGSSSDIIKKRLVEESENGLTSPRADGFTLSIAMTDRREYLDPAEYSMYSSPCNESDDLAIAALRILVGSGSTSQIPLSIRVMGRIHKLTAGQKRWYTIHLSAQEVACSIRIGFVSVLVDRCADSSSQPTLDSIEVYSTGRRGIEKWIPLGLYSASEMIPTEGQASDSVTNSLNSQYKMFRQYVTALGHFYRLMQGSFLANRTEKETVEHLIMNSALTLHDLQINESIEFLRHALDQDEESRQKNQDKAVLAGCTTFLSKCQRTLEKSSKNHSDFHRVWRSLIPSVRFCLRTAARIARVRPFNYIQGIDGSIAADASKFVIKCLGRTIADDDLVSDFVELSLLETAVANGTPRGNLGLLSGLRILLASPIQAVVLQTCASISRFCRVCDLFAAPTMAVEYECDSCFEFITDTRFTLLEHDHAFDLCPSCYQVGYDFVRAAVLIDDDHVIIKGKAVGDNPKLTWGEFRILQPVAIKKASDAADTVSSTQLEQSMGSEVAHKHQLFNDFMDCLFTGIAGLLVEELKRPTSTPSSLVWLAVDLVRHSLSNGRKIEKATQLAEALAARVCSNLQAVMCGEDWSDESLVLLEALICLFVPDRTVRDFLLGNQSNFVSVDEARDSAVSCDTHGSRVKLRQFTGGRDKGRFFYSCTKDTRHDCNFFLWAEENGELLRNDKQSEASPFVATVASFVWELLARPLMTNGTTLNSVMCSFVEIFWDRSFKERDSSLNEDLSLVKCASVNLRKVYADGVLCHHERLRDDASQHILTALWRKSKSASNDSAKTMGSIIAVEKCLELVALCASADTEGTTSWFPVLCRIMLPSKNQNSKSDQLRLLAKRSLKQLCGHNSTFSHAVRDHFVFAFYVERLLRCTEKVLHYAVMLNEKARQCGATWKSTSAAAYHLLTLRQFIGTHALVSEDTNRLLVHENAYKALHDLLAAANKRACSWRRFCGLRAIPACASSSLGVDFTTTPPLFSLFAVACISSADNQATALRLINLALARSGERKSSPEKSPDGTARLKSSDDEKEAGNTDAIAARLTMFYADSGAPEEVLSISINDVSSFSLRFVCLGQTVEIRNLSCSIAKSLCRRFDKPSLAVLFDRLTGRPLGQAGQNGKRSAEFMSLLQAILIMAGAEAIDVAKYAALFQLYFKQQVLAIRHDRANGECVYLEAITSTSVQKKRYNLSSCAACRFHEPRTKDLRAERTRPSSTRALPSTTAVDSAKMKWVPEQVTSFAKFRLDSNRESTSSEFCSFFLLKHRCVLSGIQVEVENPRRLVKTINFFYSPRPVANAVVLKKSQFDENWQPCGVLTLTRGTTRGSLTLTTPVVAANLKIEYADFYERPGSTKSSDGSLIVHCPRCTRVVTNAHGVCGNCGEVAFQCRKCRHINYDRLDAFLCVECGYCASGTFQFDLTAAVATNAIAIMNDRDYERSMHKKLVASKMHGELKSALVQRLLRHVRSRKRNSVHEEDDERIGLDLLPAFARAFTGVLPLDPGEFESDSDHTKLTLNQLGKPGHIVKTVAQADVETQNRPQSLFRSRGESISNRSWTESLFRAGRDLDGDETASDLLGSLLDSTSSLSRFASLDPSDPLSRLLASVQSRRERRDTEEGEAAALTAATPTTDSVAAGASIRSPSSGMSKEEQDVCDRLFQLMREAEREAHELEVRCAAWRRLEQGSLGDDDTDQFDPNGFEPSHCAMCAIPMAAHLLVVWLRLFQLNPNAVVIDNDMIALLVNDDPALHHLCDAKRSAVKEIALSSPHQGRPLILEALRLRIVLLHNLNAAEILGQILQSLGGSGQAEAAAPFLALAQEALESGLS